MRAELLSYGLRWLQGCGFAWDGVAGYVDAGYGVTEWRDST
ncbi:hypothetical protein [Paenibacillus odorifer]|nr:hypothetical protein [Paenibacillus odorifer]